MSEDIGFVWDEVLADFQNFGKAYTKEQLSDFDWCIKELGKLGYATTIRYVTRAYARHLFKREPGYPQGVDGMYTYSLWGPRYPNGHSAPLTEDIRDAVLVGLYNICRLDAEEDRTSSRH